MFKLLRILISAGIAVILILIILYFLPTNIKIKGLQAVTGIAPDSIKGKIESFMFTPPEKRDKILRELQASLDKIRKLDSSDKKPGEILTEIKKEISTTQEFTNQLKDINDDASITTIITSKLIDKLIGETGNGKKQSSEKPCKCEENN